MSEVLIVEDDVINQMVMRKMLTKKQVVSYEAENGLEGLNLLKEKPEITHVILDLNLPVMDGYSFIEHLNNNTTFKRIKIYVFSCNSKSTFNAKIQNRNIDISQVEQYYEKPLMIDELIKIITDDINRYAR